VAALSGEQVALINAGNYAYLTTLMADGAPQVSPVWVEADDEYVYVSTVPGRLKEQNMRRDGRVALALVDRDHPEDRQVLIRGEVVDISDVGGVDQINRLSARYLGQAEYPMLRQGQQRVKVTIRPIRVGGYLG
jgi:PPOX class probable F420-dependent enzyme